MSKFGKQEITKYAKMNVEEAFLLGVDYGDQENNPLISAAQHSEINGSGSIMVRIEYKGDNIFSLSLSRSYNEAYGSKRISSEELNLLYNMVFGGSNFVGVEVSVTTPIPDYDRLGLKKLGFVDLKVCDDEIGSLHGLPIQSNDNEGFYGDLD